MSSYFKRFIFIQWPTSLKIELNPTLTISLLINYPRVTLLVIVVMNVHRDKNGVPYWFQMSITGHSLDEIFSAFKLVT